MKIGTNIYWMLANAQNKYVYFSFITPSKIGIVMYWRQNIVGGMVVTCFDSLVLKTVLVTYLFMEYNLNEKSLDETITVKNK